MTDICFVLKSREPDHRRMAHVLETDQQRPQEQEFPICIEFGSPPFIDSLLAHHPDVPISPKRFNAIVDESRGYEESFILVQMTRQVDVSGFVANLAGTCDRPADALAHLAALGKQELDTLQQKADIDEKIPNEVFETLLGQNVTLRAVLILDDMQGDVVRKLTAIREGSPIALAFKEANKTALRDLYAREGELRRPFHLLTTEEQMKLWSGKPRIGYARYDTNHAVHAVNHYFLRPDLRSVRIPAFGNQTARDILTAITPDYFNRAHRTSDMHDNPQTPEGLIALLGKISHPLPRFIAEYLKKDTEVHQRILREAYDTEMLKDYMRRH